jgi:hypothetical protein
MGVLGLGCVLVAIGAPIIGCWARRSTMVSHDLDFVLEL